MYCTYVATTLLVASRYDVSLSDDVCQIIVPRGGNPDYICLDGAFSRLLVLGNPRRYRGGQ